MKRILGLCLSVLLLSAGCGDLCFSDDCIDVCNGGECGSSSVCSGPGGNFNGGCYCDGEDCDPYNDGPWCESDWDCWEGERCVEGECQWDEPQWCFGSGECQAGQICSLTNECRDIVEGCPLTDECLADPEGYVPDWVGIDPLYMGEATGSGITARMEFLVDFYEDHFYGEAVVETDVPGMGYLWLNLIVTGDRSGAQLDGMVIDRDASQRWFDATFEAQLVTASQIVGTVLVSSDDGTFLFNLNLWRISPCGCETTTCTTNTDCPANQVCQEGSCVPGCAQECCADTDCPAGNECQNNQCVPSCGTYECCNDSHCPAGQVCDNNQCVDPCAAQECCLAADCTAGDDCVNGSCQTPCSGPCDCELGEACVDGYCQSAQ